MESIKEQYKREASIIEKIASASGLEIVVSDDLVQVQSLVHRWVIAIDGESLLVFHNNYGRKKNDSTNDAVFPGYHQQRRCYCIVDAILGIVNHDNYSLRYPELRATRYRKYSKEWKRAHQQDEAMLAAYTRLLIEVERRRRSTLSA